jgi:hypothetical protein
MRDAYRQWLDEVCAALDAPDAINMTYAPGVLTQWHAAGLQPQAAAMLLNERWRLVGSVEAWAAHREGLQVPA